MKNKRQGYQKQNFRYKVSKFLIPFDARVNVFSTSEEVNEQKSKIKDNSCRWKNKVPEIRRMFYDQKLQKHSKGISNINQ
jgi:hypothetical protein